MSFDLSIWSGNSRITSARASYIHDRLCRGERPSEILADPNIGQFYRELNENDRPTLSVVDHSDAHVLISCDWSAAEEVFSFVQHLVQKHQLVLYDPQSDELHV